MKTYGGEDVHTQVFLTSALIGGEWSASRPGSFIPGERDSGTHWLGGPRACLDDMEKWKFLPPPGLELRPLGRPARSQSLYRLRYSGSYILWHVIPLPDNARNTHMANNTATAFSLCLWSLRMRNDVTQVLRNHVTCVFNRSVSVPQNS
jgi:hypothetical protein